MMAVKTSFDYDLVIVGGGLVGATLACALVDQTHLNIAVVEANSDEGTDQSRVDGRTLALSWGSRLILEKLGLWESVSACAEPIETIHISDRGHFGAARLYAYEEKVPALGYVIEHTAFSRILHQQLKLLDHVDYLCPATLESIERQSDVITAGVVRAGETTKLRSRLLVAADGVMSRARDLLHMGVRFRSYDQCAIVTTVTPEYPHLGVAYERFTDSGPLAVLPMSDNRCSIVWSVCQQDADDIMALDEDSFCERLQSRFGFRLGYFDRTGSRARHPLAVVESVRKAHGRAIVIGNAAHTLHPVAGQGFNLALRDIDALAAHMMKFDDPGATDALHDYESLRQHDLEQVLRFTDTLVNVFSNKLLPLAHLRAAGLLSVDLLPFVRHALARQSMGLSAVRASNWHRGHAHG